MIAALLHPVEIDPVEIYPVEIDRGENWSHPLLNFQKQMCMLLRGVRTVQRPKPSTPARRFPNPP